MKDRTNGAPPDAAAAHNRRKTRAEERIEALDKSAGVAAQADELRDRAERAEREATENRTAWQRSAADFSNYRRRTEQQREEELGLANEGLLLKMLAVADDLDRAVAHVPVELQGSPWVEGINAIDRKLRSLLDSEGVTPIDAAESPFDPRLHEAVLHEETADVPDGHVTRELQRGYRIRDRVLRPALVAVAKNDTPSTTDQTANQRGAHEAPDDRE
jgi:Molecular chaperone GrpE (heat shock protein)